MQPYTVEHGDTLQGIAELYDSTVPELMAVNNLPSPNHIYPGRSLVVPVADIYEFEKFRKKLPSEGGGGGIATPPLTTTPKGMKSSSEGSEAIIASNPRAYITGLRIQQKAIEKEKNFDLSTKIDQEIRRVEEQYNIKEVPPETSKNEFKPTMMQDFEGKPIELIVRDPKTNQPIPWESLPDKEKYSIAKMLQEQAVPGFRTKPPKEGTLIEPKIKTDSPGDTTYNLITGGKFEEASKRLHLLRMQNLREAVDAYNPNIPFSQMDKHITTIEDKFKTNLDAIDRLTKFLNDSKGPE